MIRVFFCGKMGEATGGVASFMGVMKNELRETVNDTTLCDFPDNSSSLRAEQESLSMYTCTASQWPRYSLCRDSDAGYFASRSGVAGVAEEDVSSSQDDDTPGDETDPPSDTDTEEHLPTVSSADIVPNSEDQEDVSCIGQTGASEPKRTFTTAVGESMPMAFGATAQKQGTRANVRLQGRSEREQISTSFQETDSKKGGRNDISPPVARKQPDPECVGTPVPCGQVVEDTQDVVAVEDECICYKDGEQMLMVHMDPHDYH